MQEGWPSVGVCQGSWVRVRPGAAGDLGVNLRIAVHLCMSQVPPPSLLEPRGDRWGCQWQAEALDLELWRQASQKAPALGHTRGLMQLVGRGLGWAVPRPCFGAEQKSAVWVWVARSASGRRAGGAALSVAPCPPQDSAAPLGLTTQPSEASGSQISPGEPPRTATLRAEPCSAHTPGQLGR